MINISNMRDLVSAMALSASTKATVIRFGGYASFIHNKVDRFMYNFFESMVAAMVFESACLLKGQTIALAHTWQKIVCASIIATPFITRGIAYFFSNYSLDKADRADIYLGQIWNAVNIITSVVLLIIMRPSLLKRQVIVGGLLIGTNIVSTYYLNR